MDALLTALRAAGEPTRLRLLALCAHSDLTVSELTQILGQSQPRVSRHLKLLCDAGLLEIFEKIRESAQNGLVALVYQIRVNASEKLDD